MNFRSAAGIFTILTLFVSGMQNSFAGPSYMDDAETIQPSSSSAFGGGSLPDISKHKFPRIIMAETQSMSGGLEQYSKYDVITTSGGVLNKIADLQKKYPDLMFFRQLMPTEFLGYTHSNIYCSHGHSIPFENTGSATTGCNVYAGHWLYQAGTKTRSSINSSTNTIPVVDAKRFQVGAYIVIYNSPAGSFNNAEHAKITGRNTSNNTLTVQRGYKSSASSHGSGSIVAQHVTGQAGSQLNWAFNISTQSPKDSNGRTYAQAALIFFQNNYTKDYKGNNTSAKVSGFLFDSDFYSLFTNKKADVNNDLVTDDGKTSGGYNWWGTGLENFYQSFRNQFPNKHIITGHQLARSEGASNGTQMEGWPQSNNYHSVIPEYKTLSSELANYRFYMHFVKQGPAASHVLTKTPTKIYPDGTNASTNKPFRFAFGMGLLDDGYFGSQNSPKHPDVWYDEFAVITDKSSSNYGKAVASNPNDESAVRANSGWLGYPQGGYSRVYNAGSFSASSSFITPGTFDSNINGWSGVNVNVSRDTSTSKDGSASLKVSQHTKYQSALYGAKVKGPTANLSAGQWYTLVFAAKASSTREIKANVGGYGERFMLGTGWRRYVMAFKAPASGNQRVDFTVGDENTYVWFDSVHVFKGNPNVFRRDFENGIVVVNGTDSSVTVDLGGTFQHIKGNQDPYINNGQSVNKVTLAAWDARVLIRPKSGDSGGSSSSSNSSNAEVCGAPSINTGSEQGVFIWKDCSAGIWHLVASPGGDSSGAVFSGTIKSGSGFNMVDPIGFENHDVLDMSSNRIDYTLKVWNKGTDGIDMVIPVNSNTCFSLKSGRVYLGPDEVYMSAPFDLNGLGQCN